jgi:predicted component of type VI protein secretion system
MNVRAGQLLLLLALAVVLLGITGCQTNQPSNDSARPWNAPQGWESGMPIQNEQHP